MSGCTVYPGMMERHLREELPFLATENILMRAVELGGDRQELHEVIREYSVETAKRMKETGCANDLEEKLLADERFKLTRETLSELLDIRKFIGMAPRQARDFIGKQRPAPCSRPTPPSWAPTEGERSNADSHSGHKLGR